MRDSIKFISKANKGERLSQFSISEIYPIADARHKRRAVRRSQGQKRARKPHFLPLSGSAPVFQRPKFHLAPCAPEFNEKFVAGLSSVQKPPHSAHYSLVVREGKNCDERMPARTMGERSPSLCRAERRERKPETVFRRTQKAARAPTNQHIAVPPTRGLAGWLAD